MARIYKARDTDKSSSFNAVVELLAITLYKERNGYPWYLQDEDVRNYYREIATGHREL